MQLDPGGALQFTSIMVSVETLSAMEMHLIMGQLFSALVHSHDPSALKCTPIIHASVLKCTPMVP